jgi:uncharacterized protein
VPILIIVAVMSTYFFRLTGTVYTGAFLGAMFVTWNLAAGHGQRSTPSSPGTPAA